MVFSLGPLIASNMWGYLGTRTRLREAAFRDVQNVAAIEATEARRSVLGKHALLSALIAGNQHIFSLMRSSENCAPDQACEAVRAALDEHLSAKQRESPVIELVAFSPTGRQIGISEGDAGGDSAPPSSGSHHARGAHAHERGTPPHGHGAHLPAPGPPPSHNHPHAAHVEPPHHLHVGHESAVPLSEPGAGCRAAIEHDDSISLDTDSSEPVLVIVGEVIDPNGENLGYVCGRFDFDVHAFLMATTREGTASATSFLVDEEGEVICSSLHEQGRELGRDVDGPRPVGRVAWAERARRGELHVAYAPVPDLPWGILVELPLEAAFVELEILKWQAFGFGTILSLILVGVAVIASRRIARPLSELSELAAGASGGSLGLTLRPEGPREVIDLAHSFNEMSSNLKALHDELEDRIADRTQELETSRGFLEQLLDSIDQRVLVVNLDKAIIRANRPALEDYGSDVVGKSYDVVVAVEGDPIAATIDSGEPQSLERTHGTGPAQRIVHAELFPVRSPEGEVTAVIEVARDVTADKRLQAQIVHQERMATLGVLAAGMAHDIGNPLASMLAQLRMTREIGGEERTRETLDVIERETRRISRQLQGFVGLARRRRTGIERIDLNAPVRDVVTLLAYNPKARRCQIDTRLVSDLPPVRSDEDLIVQVLLNLCINALDAMGDGGRLLIATAVEDECAVIRVEDSGPGIPQDLRDRIFDALISTKPVGKGTGLGLFMARNIAESLGGQLVLVSTSDEGTVFELRLPTNRSSEGGAP